MWEKRSAIGAAVAMTVWMLGCGAGDGDAQDDGSEAEAEAEAESEAEAEGEAEAEAESEAESGGCASAASCDDGLACTEDRCADATRECQHMALHARCAVNEVCDPTAGCSSPPPCSNDDDCPDLGPCSVVRCDAGSAACAYRNLDSDGDGHVPQICGGDDCDDANADAYPGAEELCNDGDDDCDGDIDGLTQPCGSDVGTCSPGTETCTAGMWGDCVGTVEPGLETCDGEDNDCDGAVDEGMACCNGDIEGYVSLCECCWGLTEEDCWNSDELCAEADCCERRTGCGGSPMPFYSCDQVLSMEWACSEPFAECELCNEGFCN